MAIVWGVKHLWPYLYGRKFKTVSDHKPLMWIMSVKDPGSRLMSQNRRPIERNYGMRKRKQKEKERSV